MTKDEEARKVKMMYYQEVCNVNLDNYRLHETDYRLRLYIEDIISDVEAHNLYEILAVRRFFMLRDKYVWRPNKVKKFIVFYESLKFSGMKGRQCYKPVSYTHLTLPTSDLV